METFRREPYRRRIRYAIFIALKTTRLASDYGPTQWSHWPGVVGEDERVRLTCATLGERLKEGNLQDVRNKHLTRSYQYKQANLSAFAETSPQNRIGGGMHAPDGKRCDWENLHGHLVGPRENSRYAGQHERPKRFALIIARNDTGRSRSRYR